MYGSSRIVLAMLLVVLARGLAAQDPGFSQFFANPLYLNPAFAGTSEMPRSVVNYRNQWPQKGATYTTYSLSFDSFISKMNTGWGFQLLQDQQMTDLIKVTSASVHYAYHISMDHDAFVSLGFQAGAGLRHFNPDGLVFPSMIDQLSGTVTGSIPYNLEYTKKIYPDFAVGVLGQTGDWFGGVSVHHLTRPDLTLLPGEEKGRLPMKITAHAGARLFRLHRGLLSREFMLSPNLLIQNQGSFTQINLGIYMIERSLVFGLWHRNNLRALPDAVIFMAGIAGNSFQIGYSFDYTLSPLSNYSYGSHEISLTFLLGRPNGFSNPRRLLIPMI